MNEYDHLQVTAPFQGSRKYGKTSFELGHEKGLLTGELVGQRQLLLEQLTQRFGTLSEEVSKRLDACSETQISEMAKKIFAAQSVRELGLES